MKIRTFVGTAKGAFLFTSDASRREWQIDGPLFRGWKVTAAHRAPDGTYFAATASDVYGPALHRSRDLREWTQVVAGPAYAEGGDRRLRQIWTIASGHGTVYAGVDEAGLFASRDGGAEWTPIEGLNDHATRSRWHPGLGGLCAHAILIHPDATRLWCGISAVGVFRSDDGGQTWHPKNDGVQVIIEDDEHKDIGYCVHGLALDPSDPDRIYRQDHRGMYRSTDGAETWERNENGLPSRFGFPIAVERGRGQLFSVPLESDEYRTPIDGALKVYRSRDHGDSWEPMSRGLPQQHTYAGVLRGALAVDHLEPCGVYFGTTAGSLYASADDGETWEALPCTLPRVMCVETFVGDE